MSRTIPGLIVPIRDRRSRRRILTLKNFGYAAIVLVVSFAAVMLWSEHGRRGRSDDYGRLFGKQVSERVPEARKQPEIIHEAQVPDVSSADPTLIGPAARAQILGVSEPLPATPALTTMPVAPPSARPPLQAGQQRVAIVGGPDGVAIDRTNGGKPLLRGGIFRPNP